MESGRLGLKEELIKKAWLAAMKAHKSPDKPYLLEKSSKSPDVIFSFPGFWSVREWFTRNPFGEEKIDLAQFPSLKCIGNDEVATVNGAFLKRFLAILGYIQNEMERSSTIENKQIVFTGHSSGGSIAVLVTVWLLQQQYIKQKSPSMPPLCITFGSPFVGDRVFNHALRREKWSQYFTHFVMRYDIVPRVLLAPLSSIERELSSVLDFLNPKSTHLKQEPTGEASTLYVNVMRNASSLASHAACYLMGNTNSLSETLSGFIQLSPYRPFGTYVFCTGYGDLVVAKNPDAVLQILFYSSQLPSLGEGERIAMRSVKDHLTYQSELQSLETKEVTHLDSLEGLPLSSDGGGGGGGFGSASIDPVLNNLGLSTRARLCLSAARELENQKLRNQQKIDAKMTDIYSVIKMLEGYKARCEARKVSYYDAFKISREPDDFDANVKRLELAGILDEAMEMIKRIKTYELPDEFEGRKEWLDIGTKYRHIVEPLDIANYYRHLKNEDTGSYMKNGRPKRYRFTQKWREYAQRMPSGSSGESCFWAEVEELVLCLRTNLGPSEDVKRRILNLEEEVKKWVGSGELGDDVFFEDSTFVKWWKTLPEQLRSGSFISARINN